MYIAETLFEPVGEFGSIYRDTKISYDWWGTIYLSKLNIWLLTSSFDISKQMSLNAKRNLADVRVRECTSHIQRKNKYNITYILLYTCDFVCCLLGLLFDSDDGGNTFLRNIDKLLPDHTLSSQKILFGSKVILCKHADGFAAFVGTSNGCERA
jgi:hypothetical protein